MYFLSENNDINQLLSSIGISFEDVDRLSDEEFWQLAQDNKIMKSLFSKDSSLQSPLALIYYTYHPDSESAPLVASIITPDAFTYYTNSPREVRLIQSSTVLHRHNFYELLYVIDGDLYQNIEYDRHIYPTGSCCLMNKNVHHREEIGEYCRIVFIQFTDEYIQALLNFPTLFPSNSNCEEPLAKIKSFFYAEQDNYDLSQKSYMDFIPKTTDHHAQDIIYQKLDLLTKAMQSRTENDSLQISRLLLDILCVLFDENTYQTTPVHLGSEAQRVLFDQISDFIKSKHGRTTRHELEENFHYSGDYIYRVIGKYTGLSIVDYCSKISMDYAKQQLLETNDSIDIICSTLGYTNKTQFYTQFKKTFGMTPKAFRKNNK